MNNYSMFGMAAYLLSFLIAMVVEKKKKKEYSPIEYHISIHLCIILVTEVCSKLYS